MKLRGIRWLQKAGSWTSRPGSSATVPQDVVEVVPVSSQTTDSRTLGTAASPGFPEPATAQGSEAQFFNNKQILLLNLSTIPIMFLSLMDASIVSTAIPRITEEFHSVLDIGWYGAAYQLSSGIMQPMAGKLYTYFPSKPVFLASILLFEIGSLLCGRANSSTMLIIGRSLAGAGAAGITNGTLAMVVASVPMTKRPAIIGLGLGISQIGLISGPLLGGLLTQMTTWRWCFYVNLPACPIFALPLAFITIPDQYVDLGEKPLCRFVRHKMDYVGFLLLAPAVTILLVALQLGGNQFRWDSYVVIGLLCGGGLAALVFLWAEYKKGRDAIIPLWMIRKRVVWCSCLVMTFSIATTFSMSGVYLLPTIISQLISGVTSGWIVGKTGYYLPWSVAAGVFMAVGSGLIATYSPITPLRKWIGYQIILGTGRGMGMQMPLIALQNHLEDKDVAIGTSFMMFGHTMGGAIFLSGAETIFTNGLHKFLGIYAEGATDTTTSDAGAMIDSLTSGGGSPSVGVKIAICKSLNRVFYLTMAAGAAAFCLAWGIGWKDIRTADTEREIEAAAEDQEMGKSSACLSSRQG